MKSIFIVGLGRLGNSLAHESLSCGQAVTALVRRQKAADCHDVSIVRGDLDRQETLKGLALAGRGVYYLAPPPDHGVRDTRIRNWLTAIESDELPEKIVYISTTGVYGDCQGRLVDEDVKPDPATDRSRRRLDAENVLRCWGAENRVAVVVLRVAGIYGPGRLPVRSITSGNPVICNEEAPFSNRIHAEDLLKICLAAMEHGKAGEIYNVSDGQHSSMTDYFLAVADALGLPRPPQISYTDARSRLSSSMLSYLEESRRIDNSKMLRDLGVELRYPDLASGLACSI